MDHNDEKTQQEVEKLRTALVNARSMITKQQKTLNRLTAPPYTYATVIATSEYRPPSNRQLEFTSIGGGPIEVEEDLTELGNYRVGDELEVINHNINEHVLAAEKFVIVGFDYRERIVTQLDDNRVVIDNPSQYANIFKVKKRGKVTLTHDTAIIMIEGKMLEVLLPEEININPGDTVTLALETLQIVDVASVELGGEIAFVRQVIDNEFCETDYQGSTRVVFIGKHQNDLQKGDRVVLDATGSVIIRNLGQENKRFSYGHSTGVRWNDIGGLAEAKRQMIEAVELPHSNPDIFRFYGKKPVKGVLLYGPPGCGKTMLGKATATSLAQIYSQKDDSQGFLYVKGPEILDKFVGVSEATIRSIFARARKHKEENGYPAVVFIDEADAILGKRGSGISSDIEKTIVPMFLTEMDGLEESCALVILATNRPDILDPAIVRDGRIDRKIKIERPTSESATEIFLLNLESIPLCNGYTHRELAELGSNELFSPKRVLYTIARHGGTTMDFTLGNVVSGGMVAGIVDQATSIAMLRDLDNRTQDGLRREDMVLAIDKVFNQNRDLNHSDDLSEFVYDFQSEVTGIRKLRQAV